MILFIVASNLWGNRIHPKGMIGDRPVSGRPKALGSGQLPNDSRKNGPVEPGSLIGHSR